MASSGKLGLFTNDVRADRESPIHESIFCPIDSLGTSLKASVSAVLELE